MNVVSEKLAALIGIWNNIGLNLKFILLRIDGLNNAKAPILLGKLWKIFLPKVSNAPTRICVIYFNILFYRRIQNLGLASKTIAQHMYKQSLSVT